jgi:hypothetical protein
VGFDDEDSFQECDFELQQINLKRKKLNLRKLR